MKIKGWGGSFEFLDDCVVIRRTYVIGLFQHGLKGDKRIPYSSIVALQAKRPGMLNGYIQFTIAGGVENTAGIMAAASDENSLQFVTTESFDQAYEFLQKKIGRQANPVAPPPLGSGTSLAEQLEKLANLLDRGLLSKQEFDEQKSVLLNVPSTSLEMQAPTAESIDPSLRRMQEAMDRAIANREAAPLSASNLSAPPTFGKRRAS